VNGDNLGTGNASAYELPGTTAKPMETMQPQTFFAFPLTPRPIHGKQLTGC
jgi:hypothetical protein